MKKAFVFDTNFIIENPNLREVVANLSEEFTVYVTQVSIDERLSQKYLKLKSKYDSIERLSIEYRDIAQISESIPFEEKYRKEKEFTQQGYSELFGEHIIPLTISKAIFSAVLDRVHRKLPPFSSADGASDKGFKDSLLWISILDYFQKKGEEEAILVTNDNGFKKYIEPLCGEFFDFTGKQIEIKDNGFYKTCLEAKEPKNKPTQKEAPLPNVSLLRKNINDVIVSLCGFDDEDYRGNSVWTRTFEISQEVDSEYMAIVFEKLKQVVTDHIFEECIPADIVLDLDGRVENIADIPLSDLEKAFLLYEEIQQSLPNYLPQFFSAAAGIVNRNYIIHLTEVDDDEMPF